MVKRNPAFEKAFRLLEEHPGMTSKELKRSLVREGYPPVKNNTISSWLHRHKTGGWYNEKKGAGKARSNVRGQLHSPTTPTFEQTMDTIITAFEQAKKVPALEALVWELKNKLEATKAQLSGLQSAQATKAEQEQRFRLAIQQGEINPLGKYQASLQQ